jgi:hypothetical protein
VSNPKSAAGGILGAVRPRHPSRWLRAAGALLLLAPLAATAQVIQPRLSGDGSALVLMEEIAAPPERQPLLTLEFPRLPRVRQIRVAGKGLIPPAAVILLCGEHLWTIPRSEVLLIQDRTHAFFAVAPEIARQALEAPDCRVVLAGVQIPIPLELLARVWAEEPPPSR